MSPCMQLYIDKCIPLGEKIACVAVVINLLCGQPHAIFGGCFSISGGWMLLRRELIMAEDSPHSLPWCSCWHQGVVAHLRSGQSLLLVSN